MRHGLIPFVIVIVMAAALPVSAQSDGFALTGINFDFTNPGARARGIGGAFVAIADDSTAALANPAGLAYLERELTIEGSYDHDTYPVGQLTQGEVRFESGTLSETHTPLHDPYRVYSSSYSTRPSYASLLLPVKRYRMTLAFYYASLADTTDTFTVGEGLICIEPDGTVTLPGAGDSCHYEFLGPSQEASPYPGQEISYSLSTQLLGAATGIRLGDTFSIGASLALVETEMSARAWLRHSLAYGLGEDRYQQTRIDDSDLLYSLGVLYRGDHWGWGVNYRSATSHRTENEWLSADLTPEPERAFSGTFKVPARLAAGVSLFLSDTWVVALEVDRIRYSQMLSEAPSFYERANLLDIDYRVSDVTEYHLGVEYTTFRERRGWSLRAGYWRDQTHLPWVDEPYQSGLDEGDAVRAEESLIRARYDQGIDHFTAGLGISDGRRIRVDLAVDHSPDAGTDALLSAVLYF
jgi:hypothetical protein